MIIWNEDNFEIFSKLYIYEGSEQPLEKNCKEEK